MLWVKLICVGKLKEKYFEAACAEYIKRIEPMAKLEIAVLPEEAERPGGLQREGERVLQQIPSGAFVVAMCVEGQALGSEGLAQRIEGLAASGRSRLCFIIGSSTGLAEKVKEAADLRLSMSAMTFPHHLARVMVLEQIYRALSINAGKKYHK